MNSLNDACLQLLKLEIRRDQRSDTREELNLEYLKNVILQFLMKQEERPQLVPVLAMMLQFSPEEHRQLQQLYVIVLVDFGKPFEVLLPHTRFWSTGKWTHPGQWKGRLGTRTSRVFN